MAYLKIVNCVVVDNQMTTCCSHYSWRTYGLFPDVSQHFALSQNSAMHFQQRITQRVAWFFLFY